MICAMSARYAQDCLPLTTHFGLTLREFRRARPWLRENLTGRDRFNRISDDEAPPIFYGYRIGAFPARRSVSPLRWLWCLTWAASP